MRTTALLFFACLWTAGLQAQSLTWSPPQEMPAAEVGIVRAKISPTYLHWDAGQQQAYALRQDGQLTIFDAQMKQLGTAQLSYNGNAYAGVELLRCITVGAEMVVLFSGKPKGGSGVDVFGFKLDKATRALASEPILFGNYPPKIDLGIEDVQPIAHNFDLYDNGTYFFASPKSKRFLLIFPGEVKGRDESCYATVFDSNLNVIWSGGLSIPYPDGHLAINECEIDDLGNVYVAGEDIHAFKDGIYRVFLFKQGELIKEYAITHENRKLFDMRIDASKSGAVKCVGFYANEKHYNGYNGVAYISIDSETHAITETYHPFAANIQDLFLSNGQRKKKERGEEVPDVEIEGYTDRDCVATPDGGVILLAEDNGIGKLHIASSESYTSGGYYTEYGSILAIKLDASGNLAWSDIIQKEAQTLGQAYDDGIFASFSHTLSEEGIYLHFNELVKKELRQVQVHINNAGKVTRTHAVSAVKKDAAWLAPAWCHAAGNGAWMFFSAYSSHNYRLGLWRL